MGGEGGMMAGVEPFTSAEVQSLYSSTCAGCHTNGGNSGNLNLDVHEAATISVASGQSALNLIEPGNAEESYLYHKLAGTHASVGGGGSQMPLGRAPWTEEQLERYAAWINSL